MPKSLFDSLEVRSSIEAFKKNRKTSYMERSTFFQVVSSTGCRNSYRKISAASDCFSDSGFLFFYPDTHFIQFFFFPGIF
jgi:hypothetical protein